MLGMAIMFAILALITGVLGFVTLAGSLAVIAKVLLFVFLALFVISLIFGGGGGRFSDPRRGVWPTSFGPTIRPEPWWASRRSTSHSFGLFLSSGADALPAVGRLLEKAKEIQSEDQPTFFDVEDTHNGPQQRHHQWHGPHS